MFKKVRCLTRPTQSRQDVPFHRQGRSHFDARSVHGVREHGKMARTPLAAFFNIPIIEKSGDHLAWCPDQEQPPGG